VEGGTGSDAGTYLPVVRHAWVSAKVQLRWAIGFYWLSFLLSLLALGMRLVPGGCGLDWACHMALLQLIDRDGFLHLGRFYDVHGLLIVLLSYMYMLVFIGSIFLYSRVAQMLPFSIT